jgi:hypothetical protein
LAEFLNATGGVHDLLLAGVKRMALRTYFNREIAASSGAGFELVTAAASNADFFVSWMDFWFHFHYSLQGWVAMPFNDNRNKARDYPRKQQRTQS